MVPAGVDVVRMNFSHGAAADHAGRAETIREASARAGRPVGILADLQGPKDPESGNSKPAESASNATRHHSRRAAKLETKRVGLDYKDLPKDVRAGDVLLLDDGRLKLDVTRGPRPRDSLPRPGWRRTVEQQGHQPPGWRPYRAGAHGQDMDDIKTAASIGVDFVAVSFPKTAADMYMARQLMRAAGCQALLIAKIERTEAVANLEIVERPRMASWSPGGSCRGSGRCRSARASETHDPDRTGSQQTNHHRHADDGIDDYQPVPTRPKCRTSPMPYWTEPMR